VSEVILHVVAHVHAARGARFLVRSSNVKVAILFRIFLETH
jgi:hypothetical protein